MVDYEYDFLEEGRYCIGWQSELSGVVCEVHVEKEEKI